MKRWFRPVTRNIKRHFGASARRVVVRSYTTKYSVWLIALLGLVIGYLLAYWQFTGGQFGILNASLDQIKQENQLLQGKFVLAERQLHVSEAAQKSLANELSVMQGETMRLKEDVAFYKNILSEDNPQDVLKLHSFKINRTEKPLQWQYHILLVQSGRHDQLVRGTILLQMEGMQNGKPAVIGLQHSSKPVAPQTVSFKYYQRIDGDFDVPDDFSPASLILYYFPATAGIASPANQLPANPDLRSRAKISAKVDFLK